MTAVMGNKREPEEQFIYIIQCFIHKVRPDIQVIGNSGKLRYLAGIHGLTAVLDYINILYPDVFPEYPKEEAGRSLTRAACLMALKNAQMEETEKLLSGHGISYIPFKGYVLKRLYPEPELRSFGDVDILIHSDDRKKCNDCLLNAGYTLCKDWEPVYSYRKGNLYLEVHTELLDTEISSRVRCREFFKKDPWGNTVQTGYCRQEFSAEYHFLYLIAHIAKHISGSGAGIRMYLDLALFLEHTPEMDWNWLIKALEETRLIHLSSHIFLLLERCFGIKIPVEYDRPEDEKYLLFLEYTMEAGTFGFENRGRGSIIMKKKSVEESGPVAVIMEKLFPSADTLKARYRYLQKAPWLLPAAWVHRFILTGRKATSHMQEAKAIMYADPEETERLIRIQEELGL